MPATSSNATLDALLPPFPEGWFFIATRKDVLKNGLIEKTWMGEQVLIWSDDDGRITVSDAFCPHLGSSLAPDAGGRVGNGRLVCPFHGFEFDVTGQCVATPYAAAPRSARLRVYETREIAGLVFAWWGIDGRAPQWELPAEQPQQDGWSNVEVVRLRFPGHPQETTENSVDLAHLRYVHGYGNINGDYPVSVEGHRLVSSFDFSTTRRLAPFVEFTLSFSASAQVYGLGYSFVDIQEHSVGMNLRLWVLATPVDGTLIDMTLASQVAEIRQPKRRVIGLGFLPTKLRASLINKIVVRIQRQDVLQDVTIWQRKRYLARPRLCRSDGEIMTYRAYCSQFYPDSDRAREPSERPSEPIQLATS